MENVESSIKPYYITQSVLEAWLKSRFPHNEVTVTVKDADYVIIAPEAITQRDVKHLKHVQVYTG